jgi:hypothetical protein
VCSARRPADPLEILPAFGYALAHSTIPWRWAMTYEWRHHDRALVLDCLQHGEYDAIATSSQGALDELAHLTAELGVWEALEVIQVHREREGIPDDLLSEKLN